MPDTSFFSQHKYIRAVAEFLWLPSLVVVMALPLVFLNRLLFHTLAEFFAICIAVTSSVVAWNTFRVARNHYLLVLGSGYFAIGMLDLAHTLTFSGMTLIPGIGSNMTVQFWVVARLYEAILLLIAPAFLQMKTRRGYLVLTIAFALIFSVALVAGGYLPVMLVPGDGLTESKVIAEYIAITLLIAALAVTWREHRYMDRYTLSLITLSILLTIAAELVFTLYSGLNDIVFIVGHILKVFSYWAIYRLLIESSLKEPFRHLVQEASTYDAIPDETMVVDTGGIIRQVNEAVRHTTGLTSAECLDKHCHELQHDDHISQSACHICSAIREHKNLDSYAFQINSTGQWYEVSLTEVSHGEHTEGMVHVRRNITREKRAQERVMSLNRLYSVRSFANKVIAEAPTHEDMFQGICDIAIRHGGFRMAWIGLVDDLSVVPQASAGDELGYLEHVSIRLDDSLLAAGPVGQAILRNEVTYIAETREEESFTPWRGAAEISGFRSLAMVPLTDLSGAIGICGFYSDTSDAFDQKMLTLLGTLGNDISVAIQRINEKQKQKESESKIRQLSLAVEQSANAIIITGTDFSIEYVNKAFISLTGYQSSDVLGMEPSLLMDAEFREKEGHQIMQALIIRHEWSGELRCQRKDGSKFWASQSVSALKDENGNICNYVTTFEDITRLYHAKKTIEQLAFYDPLTNLPNRRLLSDRLTQSIEHADRTPGTMVAVMVFDLDNFKTVNDSLGHNYGDELLKHVAELFCQHVRSEDTVSRQGGDEFTIVLSGMKEVGHIADIADSVIQKMSQPFEVLGQQVVIGTSIGIAVYPADAETVDELLRHADIAMYHAKDEGKNNFQFFREDMNRKAHERMKLENNLRRAITENHFELYYQPQVDLRNGSLVGAEALIRWMDPVHGMIPPSEFIPVAEDTGLIGPLGDWVIQTACRDMVALRNEGLPAIKVAVNVSAYQFRHGQHLRDVIHAALEETGMAAGYLTVELTESILINDISDARTLLNELRDLGITLAIDDFGTGYSSLSYLKQLPIDVLKIDQSFIRDLLVDDSDKAIVSAIIAMAQQLDLSVLAEGVETAEHQTILEQQCCDYAQGFLYCRPVPREQLVAFWKSHQPLI